MRLFNVLSLAAMILALAACGGGDGGNGIASAPVPLPSPAPAPTPSPSPATNPSPAPPTAEVYSGSASSALAITWPTQQSGWEGLESPFVQNSANSGNLLKITRQSDGGYTIESFVTQYVSDGLDAYSAQFSFPIGSRNEQTGNPAVSEFSARGGAGVNTHDAELRVELANPNNSRNYVNFASLSVCNLPGGTACAPNEMSRSQIVFGNPTPLAEIPRNGLASFSGLFSAPAKSGNDIIDGIIGLQVDFASRGVSGRLSNVNVAVDAGLTGAVSKVPDFTLNGLLASNGLLSASMTPGAGSAFIGGHLSGNFFGPNVSEVGGTIHLMMGADGIDPFFAGTFSAAKQ